jgi:hypothetical protein
VQPEIVRCHHRAGGEHGRPLVAILISAGVPKVTAYGLECRDVHEMTLVIARAKKWAEGERTLVAEIPDRPLPTPSWLSVHREAVTVVSTVFTWLLVFYVFWRIA